MMGSGHATCFQPSPKEQMELTKVVNAIALASAHSTVNGATSNLVTRATASPAEPQKKEAVTAETNTNSSTSATTVAAPNGIPVQALETTVAPTVAPTTINPVNAANAGLVKPTSTPTKTFGLASSRYATNQNKRLLLRKPHRRRPRPR